MLFWFLENLRPMSLCISFSEQSGCFHIVPICLRKWTHHFFLDPFFCQLLWAVIFLKVEDIWDIWWHVVWWWRRALCYELRNVYLSFHSATVPGISLVTYSIWQRSVSYSPNPFSSFLGAQLNSLPSLPHSQVCPFDKFQLAEGGLRPGNL